METQFYQGIKQVKDPEQIITRFPIEPRYRGIAGHFGGKNYDSFQEQLKYLSRSVSRKIAPWLHI